MIFKKLIGLRIIRIIDVRSVFKINPQTIEKIPKLFNARGKTIKIFEIRYENVFIKESSLNFKSFCRAPSETWPREEIIGRTLRNFIISLSPSNLKIFEITPAKKYNETEDNNPNNILICTEAIILFLLQFFS